MLKNSSLIKSFNNKSKEIGIRIGTVSLIYI